MVESIFILKYFKTFIIYLIEVNKLTIGLGISGLTYSIIGLILKTSLGTYSRLKLGSIKFLQQPKLMRKKEEKCYCNCECNWH